LELIVAAAWLSLPENEPMPGLLTQLGQMDIYLIDQLQKGSFQEGMKILDAGCGEGRNLSWFLYNGFEVYACDTSIAALEKLREKALSLNPELDGSNFRQEAIEKMSFAAASFDAVICNAVLHFAKDEKHFHEMLDSIWKVLKPGGLFFSRLASSIGIENRIQQLEGRHYLLPDGSRRFLVDETFLLRATHRLGAHFQEPIKTVNVQNQRCMTTWVLHK
jgi:2-polyprenyl-3-methyl-5-hydroxy-6-metoxy-1,4-benzoquinol methylase